MASCASKGSSLTGPWILSVPFPGNDAERVRAAGPRTGHVTLSTPTSRLLTLSWAAGSVVSSVKATLAALSLVRSTPICQGFGAGPARDAAAAGGARTGSTFGGGAAPPPPAMARRSICPLFSRRTRASSPEIFNPLSVTSCPARSKRLRPTPRRDRVTSFSLAPGLSSTMSLTVTSPLASTVGTPSAVGAYSTTNSVPSTAANLAAGVTLSSVTAILAPSTLTRSTRTFQGFGAGSGGGGAAGTGAGAASALGDGASPAGFENGDEKVDLSALVAADLGVEPRQLHAAERHLPAFQVESLDPDTEARRGQHRVLGARLDQAHALHRRLAARLRALQTLRGTGVGDLEIGPEGARREGVGERRRQIRPRARQVETR